MSTYTQHKAFCRLENYSNYDKNETILSISDRPTRIGVLQEGEAHLSIVDDSGKEITYELISAGDCFGGYYLTLLPTQEAYITADTACRVMFVDLPKVLTGCNELCDNHREMMKKIIMFTAHHSQLQSIRVNILGQRTLRDKLLTYLQYQQRYYSQEEEFMIPMNLSSLASYLSVDRSAMMRELKKMKEEGIISSNGRCFTLHELKHSE